MARIALAGSVEVRTAGFSVAGQDVQRAAGIPVTGNGLHALVQKMRQVHDLICSKAGGMPAAFFERRTDSVAQTIPQNNGRANEIRTVVGAFRIAAMTIDAVLRIDNTASAGGRRIDALAFGGTRLHAKDSRKQ